MNMSSYCQKSAQTFLSMRNPVFGCRMPQCITFLQQPEVPASFTNKTRALLHQDLVKSGPKHSRKHRSGTENYERQACQPSVINVRAIALALAPVCVLLRDAPALALTIHQEPENALSLPTWVIHISSVVEWAIAMALVWKYAQVTGNPKWKGLTWGMMPLLGGALCACTYHFYYNSPDLDFLVAVQASLTWIGNATCAAAAYRIYKSSEQEGAA